MMPIFQRVVKIFSVFICAIFFITTVGFITAKASGNESAELPSPISFKCDTQLIKNAVLIDSIDFELLESNSVITHTISDTSLDLILMFHDVSTAIDVSLNVIGDDRYCVGFCGENNAIYVQINPNLEYEIELSPGVVISDDMKQIETVDCCSGVLEIYQVGS